MPGNQDQSLTDGRIRYLINNFKQSERFKWMGIGRQYYMVENDINNRRMTKMVDGVEVEETNRANNRLAHATYKLQVDEKVSYLLAKEFTLDGQDDIYDGMVRDVLGKKFAAVLYLLGFEASNCGIGWLFPYIDENGKFKTLVIPAEQCIPVWRDNTHASLDAMIRVYDTIQWIGSRKKKTTHVEYWTADGCQSYIDSGNILKPYNPDDIDDNGPVPHFYNNGVPMSWGKVPFIAFKNNHIEMPDIKFTKSLMDQYDKARSDAANYIDEVKNLVYILKGYGGEDIHEFMKTLNEDRAIPIDDPQEGDVTALTPKMDITAVREHYEQLKKDITEDGQSINKDLDKFGNNPSGVALKFMYAGLDLKCNAMERYFKDGFQDLLYFVNLYLGEQLGYGADGKDVDILFNRDLKVNDAETVDNLSKSQTMLSKKTILAHHPYVIDVEEELKEIDEEQTEDKVQFDSVPVQNTAMNPVPGADETGTEREEIKNGGQ